MYIIPANSKKGILIANIFRISDLVLFLVGAVITIILLVAIPKTSILLLMIKLAPIVVCGVLVMPIPYYHNVLVFLIEFINYRVSTKIYIWKGWCVKDEYKES